MPIFTVYEEQIQRSGGRVNPEKLRATIEVGIKLDIQEDDLGSAVLEPIRVVADPSVQSFRKRCCSV